MCCYCCSCCLWFICLHTDSNDLFFVVVQLAVFTLHSILMRFEFRRLYEYVYNIPEPKTTNSYQRRHTQKSLHTEKETDWTGEQREITGLKRFDGQNDHLSILYGNVHVIRLQLVKVRRISLVDLSAR